MRTRAPAAQPTATVTPAPVDELLALLDWLPASVALWDRDVRLRYGNRRALTRFGRPYEQLLGTHLSDVVEAHAVELSARYINGALAGTPQQVERAMIDADGQRYNAHQVTHIPTVSGGAVRGYCALAVDITASIDGYQQARRAREQAALREQRDRIAQDLERQHVVDELLDATERLDLALERAADALPPLRSVADAIEHSIAELRATVPAQLDGRGDAAGSVTFPAMAAPVEIAPERFGTRRTGVPWPPDLTGQGWTADEACALLDLLPVEVAIWDQSLRNVFANRAAVRWFGHADRGEVYGESAQVLLGADVFEAANVAYAEAVLVGEARQFDRSVLYPGGLRHLQVYVAPRQGADGTPDGLYSLVIDVTQRVEAELALQEARAELVAARHRERIADQLHNLVIQRLFAAGLAASTAADGTADTADSQLRSVQDNIVTALEVLEFAVNALHENVALVDLLPQLARAVHDIADAAGITIGIESVGSAEYIPPEIGNELLAVAEVAVGNVVRHAAAERVVVTIAADTAGVWLRIADNGRGIVGAVPGKGMSDMLARAERLDGTCTLEQLAPSGTIVDFRVPLPD